MLDQHLQLAQGIQVAMTLEEESILVVVPTNDLVAELAELHSRALVGGRTLGEELERNLAIMVAKLKAELNESSSSLKARLEAMGSLDEKMRQVITKADKAKKEVAALKVELEVEKVDRARV